MNTNTTRSNVRPALTAASFAAALAMAAGCYNKQDGRVNGAAFRPNDEPRSIDRLLATQAASGARTESTLRAYHFDRDDLNSLGQQKLDLMLKDDDAATPLTVYLDVAQDGTYDARQGAVQAYLRDRGLTPAQIKVVAGPNLNNLNPTGPALRAKKLLDTGAPVAVNPEPAGSPAAGGFGPSGGK